MRFQAIAGMIVGMLFASTATAQMKDTPPPVGDKPPHEGERPMPPKGFMGPMAETDTNHDGAISKKEFLAQAAKHFAAMDANGDGKITPEEAHAFHEKMREEMGAHGGPGEGHAGPGGNEGPGGHGGPGGEHPGKPGDDMGKPPMAPGTN